MPSSPSPRLRAIIAQLLLVAMGCGKQSTAPPSSPTSGAPTSGVADKKLAVSAAPQKYSPAVLPQFVNVAEESGVRFTFFSDIVPNRYFLPEIMGGGAAWLDFDGDGSLDLYLPNGCHLVRDPNAPDTEHLNGLFRNRGGGQFEDVSRRVLEPSPGYGQGVAVGDFDADGFPDLYLANYGANVLLHNNGDGTFLNVTAAAGVADELWGSSPIWLDLDGDENLDLYLTNYLLVTLENTKFCEYDGVIGYCGPGSYEPAPDRVFIGQGDGTFRERSEQLGLVGEGGKGLATVALDFDNDLKPEIYVANDMMPNFLFSQSQANQPAGSESDRKRYANVANQSGCAVSLTGENEASMGVACADFDGDQFTDIFVTHYYAQKNTLYRNLGSLMFHDDSLRTRVAATSYDFLGFGTVAIDYDQDCAKDIFIANGHVLGPNHSPNEMTPQLLRNDGKGIFMDISEHAGDYFRDRWLGRGAASGDYDQDGDLDVLVTHINRAVALLRNDTRTGHHWIGFDLRTPSRVPPVGGRVVVRAGERTLALPVIAGGSYLCSPDPRLLTGLGGHSGAVDVEVHWTSGRVDTFTGLECDRYWRIVEGGTPAPLRPAN